jgi:citrate lyase beta subunit
MKTTYQQRPTRQTKGLIFAFCLSFAAFAAGTLIYCSNANYLNAIQAAQTSEGTDAAIYEAMAWHGFTGDIFYEPSQVEKIKALFNQPTK